MHSQGLLCIPLLCLLAQVLGAPQFNQRGATEEEKIISDAWKAFGGPLENAEKSKPNSDNPRISNKRTSFQQKTQYLPVLKVLLKVMETEKPSPNDVNTLMILTRDLLKQIPNDQFNFGSNSWLGKVRDLGLPESGDIIVDVNRIPHIRTQWGSFPISDVSFMTEQDRKQFIRPVRTLINVLEKDDATPEQTNLLLEESNKLTELMSRM